MKLLFKRAGTENVQECFKWTGTQLGKLHLSFPEEKDMFGYAADRPEPKVDEGGKQTEPNKPWPGLLVDGPKSVNIPIGHWIVKNGPKDFIIYEPEFFEVGYKQVK